MRASKTPPLRTGRERHNGYTESTDPASQERRIHPPVARIAPFPWGSGIALSPDCPLRRSKPPQTKKQAISIKPMTCSFNGGA